MKILVTGGAGFIGSNLVYDLNKRGYTNITIVDRLGSGDKWKNLIGLKYSNYLEVEEFRNFIIKNRCDYDILFLLGSCSSTREYNSSYFAKNNKSDLIETISWAQIYLTNRPPRIIYASSAATYGNGEQKDSLLPYELTPNNPYGFSKNSIDQILFDNKLLDHMVGLKYFNVFGPNSQHKGIMIDFVSKTYKDIIQNKEVCLYNTHEIAPNGQDARDFLYVKDATDITLWFALDEKGRKANGLFNVGSGNPNSWKDVVNYTIDSMNSILDTKTINTVYKTMPDELKQKFQFYTKADISKLRNAGYNKDITSTQDAIKDYVEKYLIPNKNRGQL